MKNSELSEAARAAPVYLWNIGPAQQVVHGAIKTIRDTL